MSDRTRLSIAQTKRLNELLERSNNSIDKNKLMNSLLDLAESNPVFMKSVERAEQVDKAWEEAVNSLLLLEVLSPLPEATDGLLLNDYTGEHADMVTDVYKKLVGILESNGRVNKESVTELTAALAAAGSNAVIETRTINAFYPTFFAVIKFPFGSYVFS